MQNKSEEGEQILDFSEKMIKEALEKLKTLDNAEDYSEIQKSDNNNEQSQLDKLTDLAKRIIQNQTDRLKMEIQKKQNFKLVKQEIYNPCNKKMKKIKSTQQEEFQISKKLYEESFQRKRQKEINEIKREQALLEQEIYSPYKNKVSENIIKSKQNQGQYQPIQQRYSKIQKEKKEKLNLLLIQKQHTQQSPPNKHNKSKTPNFKATFDRFDEWENKKKSKINEQIAIKKVNELQYQSFQPNINDRSRNIFESNVRKNLASPDVVYRLLDQGRKKQLHINELRKQTLPTFQPSININSVKMLNKKRIDNKSALYKDNTQIITQHILDNSIATIQNDRIRSQSPQKQLSQSPPKQCNPQNYQQSIVKKSPKTVKKYQQKN